MSDKQRSGHAAGHKNRYQAQLESIDGKIAEFREDLRPGFEHTVSGASEGPVKRRTLSAGARKRWHKFKKAKALK